MKILLNISLINNICLVIILIANMFAIKNDKLEPKTIANFGFLLAVFLVTYMLCFITLVICFLLKLYIIKVLISLLFVLVPFIIGKLVKHNSLLLYSNIQLLFFILSAVFIFISL